MSSTLGNPSTNVSNTQAGEIVHGYGKELMFQSVFFEFRGAYMVIQYLSLVFSILTVYGAYYLAYSFLRYVLPDFVAMVCSIAFFSFFELGYNKSVQKAIKVFLTNGSTETDKKTGKPKTFGFWSNYAPIYYPIGVFCVLFSVGTTIGGFVVKKSDEINGIVTADYAQKHNPDSLQKIIDKIDTDYDNRTAQIEEDFLTKFKNFNDELNAREESAKVMWQGRLTVPEKMMNAHTKLRGEKTTSFEEDKNKKLEEAAQIYQTKRKEALISVNAAKEVNAKKILETKERTKDVGTIFWYAYIAISAFAEIGKFAVIFLVTLYKFKSYREASDIDFVESPERLFPIQSTQMAAIQAKIALLKEQQEQVNLLAQTAFEMSNEQKKTI